jgi:hypothetical protein
MSVPPTAKRNRSAASDEPRFTLTRSCAPQVRDLSDVGLVNLLDASVNVFPGVRCVGSADDLVLVGQPVADP